MLSVSEASHTLAPRCFADAQHDKPKTYPQLSSNPRIIIPPSSVILSKPVSSPLACHAERSEASHAPGTEMLRCTQHDKPKTYHPISTSPPLVILSEAKDLTRRAPRCFAALSMTMQCAAIIYSASGYRPPTSSSQSPSGPAAKKSLRNKPGHANNFRPYLSHGSPA